MTHPHARTQMVPDLFGPYLGMPVEVERWPGDGPHKGTLYICQPNYRVAQFFDGIGLCRMQCEPGDDGIWRPAHREWRYASPTRIEEPGS